jgi:hypothetical protein
MKTEPPKAVYNLQECILLGKVYQKPLTIYLGQKCENLTN